METIIPKISNKKLAELRKRIRPLVRFARGAKGLFESGKGTPYYIVPKAPRTTTFLYEPIAEKEATGLKALSQIKTHHTTGGFFFKPSEAEVLAQIPEELLAKVVAYEVVDYDMSNAREDGDSTALVQLYTARGGKKK